MQRAFHLRVFGPPALLDPESRVHRFRTKKQLALLVYLSIHRDSPGVSRAQLVDLLWPGVEEKRGRHSLSQGLSVIRQILGADAVVAVGNHLSLSASLRSDVDIVCRNSDTDIDLGHPLQDFEDCAGADFAHWVDAARQRILASARATLLRAFREARSRGETKLVHHLATRLYCVDPVNEVAAQALAERFLLDGDVGGASLLLRDFLTRAEQAGDEGNHANIRRLIERIESGAHPATDTQPAPRQEESRDASEFLVGRAKELSRLEAMWEQAKTGSLHTCLMSGVAGIGKTALMRRFATSIAARGHLVLVIRCEEIGKAVPFAALADLIGELSKDPSLGGTDPYWLAEASRIAPALRAKYPGLPSPDQAPGESVRLRVAEALYRMLETVAEGSPLLIAIDDIQHLDQASRDVLHIVARRLSEHPAIILGAARIEGFDSATLSEPPSSDLGKWHSKLELPPLSLEEGRTLVAKLTQDLESEVDCTRIRERITRLADGNPYFLEMLISDWRVHRGASLAASEAHGGLTGTKWRPPDTLRLTFSRHYEGLRFRGRQALELLAVAGRAMNASELGELLGIARGKASRIVLEIIERGVLRLEGDAVSFKNELHRAFVYYAMADEARRYHHGRLAWMLMAHATASNPSSYLEASHHFVEAGMGKEAIDSAVAGARDAVSHGAPQEAERALREAVEIVEGPPDEALLLLAESLNQQGRYPEAVEWLRRVRPERTAKSLLAAKASLHAEAMVRGRLGDTDEISSAVQRGLDAARGAENTLQMVKALQAAAELAGDSGDLERLLEAEHEAQAIARDETNPEAAGYGHLTTGFCLWARGRFAEAYRFLTKSAEIFERIGHGDLVRALNGRAICAWGVGEIAITIDSFDRALFFAGRAGDYSVATNSATNTATTFTDLGEFEEATRAVERALAFDKRVPHNRYSSTMFNTLAALCIVQQDFTSAAAALQSAQQSAQQTGLSRHLACSLYSRADYYLATRMPEEALKGIAEGNAIFRRAARVTPVFQGNILRLNMYRDWVLGHGDEVPPIPAKDEVHLSLAAFVEVTAFREWTLEQSGKPILDRPNAEDLIGATGLEGLRILLETVGTLSSGCHRGRVVR